MSYRSMRLITERTHAQMVYELSKIIAALPLIPMHVATSGDRGIGFSVIWRCPLDTPRESICISVVTEGIDCGCCSVWCTVYSD